MLSGQRSVDVRLLAALLICVCCAEQMLAVLLPMLFAVVAVVCLCLLCASLPECWPHTSLPCPLPPPRFVPTLLTSPPATFPAPDHPPLPLNPLPVASKQDPSEILHKYGADALRLYLINSPVVRAEPLRFKVCSLGVWDLKVWMVWGFIAWSLRAWMVWGFMVWGDEMQFCSTVVVHMFAVTCRKMVCCWW